MQKIEKTDPTVVKVLILAGGMGSRSENPDLPKIFQTLDADTQIIDLQLREIQMAGFSKVQLLLGHRSEVVIQHLDNLREAYPLLEVTYLIDRGQLGTRACVQDAISQDINFDRFLLILGDTAISAPLGTYCDRWVESGQSVAIFCHPNLHMHDSDIIALDEYGTIRQFKEKDSNISVSGDLIQLAATGAVFFTREAADSIATPETDISKGLVKASLASNKGLGLITSHYFKDSGTPERLKSIREDFQNGAISRRGGVGRPCIFLDRDGTVFQDLGSSRSTFEFDELDSRIAESIARCNRFGVPVFIVTNQPGVAKGEIETGDVFRIHALLGQALAPFGALIDGLAFCPHHPDKGFDSEVITLKIECDCRKPKPGMLNQLAVDHGLDLKRSYFIGDTVRDQGAAFAVDAKFIQADYLGATGTPTWVAIDSALEGLRVANY